MQTATRSPNYLSRNHYSYCFRMKVPKDLWGILTKKELRYSLKTGNLSKAKPMARFIAGNIQLVFRRIRKGEVETMNITAEQVIQYFPCMTVSLFIMVLNRNSKTA